MTFIPLSEGSIKRVHFFVSELALALMPVTSSPIIPSPFTVTTSQRYVPYGIYVNVPPVPAVTQIQYATPGASAKLFSPGNAEIQEEYFPVAALNHATIVMAPVPEYIVVRLFAFKVVFSDSRPSATQPPADGMVIVTVCGVLGTLP